jgi:hypothetical protein
VNRVWAAAAKTTSTSPNPQRDIQYEGRCRVSVKRKEWKTLTFVLCEPRLGGGSHKDFNELKNLQRDTLNEGRCEVSGRRIFNAV